MVPLLLECGKTASQEEKYRAATTPKQKMKMVKKDLADRAFRKGFLKSRGEDVHLRGGGRSRCRNSGVEVSKNVESISDLVDSSKKFFELGRFRKRFGDPKKLQVKTRVMKVGKKKITGVSQKSSVFTIEPIGYNFTTVTVKGSHRAGKIEG